MADQKAVFINATDCEKTEQLNDMLKGLLNSSDNLVPHFKNEDIESHLWNAETKYYNADIHLTILKKKSIMNEKFSHETEAVVLYFDSGKNKNGLDRLDTWMSFLNMWEPAIKLAVCENCDRDGINTISRVTIQEWCLDHEFELVELNPDMEDYDEYEDVGIKRIRSALLAHIWPNMDMKNPNNAVKKVESSTCAAEIARAASGVSEDAQTKIDELLGKQGEFDDILGGENEEDDFEKLFCRLKVMKDQASSLPEEERKNYAENMVKAFWNALGGDDDEFDGLSSGDEASASAEKGDGT
uniref:alpha- and gamma-adaptin-binding protein p34-like n=1 Tax=Styela clava TaxID=7725 RepID=UPI00193AA440|nr:alpha- and gamma-adaptin-binding protein p34-like [Styela clava]